MLESSARAARVRSPQQVFGYLSDSTRIDESIGRGVRFVTTAVPSASVIKPGFRLMFQLAFRICLDSYAWVGADSSRRGRPCHGYVHVSRGSDPACGRCRADHDCFLPDLRACQRHAHRHRSAGNRRHASHQLVAYGSTAILTSHSVTMGLGLGLIMIFGSLIGKKDFRSAARENSHLAHRGALLIAGLRF